MTDDEFQIVTERAREGRNLEFKTGGPIDEIQLLRKVIRAVLGMTNTREGGRVILGVEERSGISEFTGMSRDDALTWTIDAFGDKAANWVDSAVSVDIELKYYRGSHFVVIEVDEFEENPVFARRGFQSPAGDMVLREGALYVRGSRKPETVEVRNSVEMQRLLDLALEKRLLRFGRHARLAGLLPTGSDVPSDDELFAREIEDYPT
jgi:predicted HTH transcriptional regulator